MDVKAVLEPSYARLDVLVGIRVLLCVVPLEELELERGFAAGEGRSDKRLPRFQCWRGCDGIRYGFPAYLWTLMAPLSSYRSQSVSV